MKNKIFITLSILSYLPAGFAVEWINKEDIAYTVAKVKQTRADIKYSKSYAQLWLEKKGLVSQPTMILPSGVSIPVIEEIRAQVIARKKAQPQKRKVSRVRHMTSLVGSAHDATRELADSSPYTLIDLIYTSPEILQIEQLLQDRKDIDINVCNNCGVSAMRAAIGMRRPDIVQLLLDKQADADNMILFVCTLPGQDQEDIKAIKKMLVARLKRILQAAGQ